jgi:hypothetical protein
MRDWKVAHTSEGLRPDGGPDLGFFGLGPLEENGMTFSGLGSWGCADCSPSERGSGSDWSVDGGGRRSIFTPASSKYFLKAALRPSFPSPSPSRRWMKPISSMTPFASHESLQHRQRSCPDLPVNVENLPFLPQNGHGSFLSCARVRSANCPRP